jgi:hypothetical protein
MGATRHMSADWLPGAAVAAVMSGVGSLLSWRVASAQKEGRGETEIRQLESEGTGLRQDIRDLREDLRAGAAEMRSLNALVIKLQASQDVLNHMQAKALDAICQRQEEHGRLIADNAKSMAIVNELLKQKGMME